MNESARKWVVTYDPSWVSATTVTYPTSYTPRNLQHDLDVLTASSKLTGGTWGFRE